MLYRCVDGLDIQGNKEVEDSILSDRVPTEEVAGNLTTLRCSVVPVLLPMLYVSPGVHRGKTGE